MIESIESKVNGLFWTREAEMVEELEELGFEVGYTCGEYVEITATEDEDDDEGTTYLLYLGHANDTMWVESIREM